MLLTVLEQLTKQSIENSRGARKMPNSFPIQGGWIGSCEDVVGRSSSELAIGSEFLNSSIRRIVLSPSRIVSWFDNSFSYIFFLLFLCRLCGFGIVGWTFSKYVLRNGSLSVTASWNTAIEIHPVLSTTESLKLVWPYRFFFQSRHCIFFLSRVAFPSGLMLSYKTFCSNSI